MSGEDDFQVTVTGKFVECWVCRAPRSGPYRSFTAHASATGQTLLTPHIEGCTWSEEAARHGSVSPGMARALYGTDVDR